MKQYFVFIDSETLQPTFYDNDGNVVAAGDRGFISWLEEGNIPDEWRVNDDDF